MAEVQITDARDTVKLMAGGILKGMVRYEYRIGDLGPFSYEVESDKDTPEGLLKEIERRKKIIAAVK